MWCYINHQSRNNSLVRVAENSSTESPKASLGETLPLPGGLSDMGDTARPGDLFLITLGDGTQWFVEAIRGKKKSLRFVCQGEQFSVRDGEFVSEGFYPKLSDPWVKRHPLLVSSLEEIRRLQKRGDAMLPSVVLADKNTRVSSVERVTTLSEFEDDIQRDSSLWCDGTGPDDAPLCPIDQSLLSAGELIALMHGGRGVALLQLSLPVDMGGTRLPLLRPFVFEVLKRIDASKDVVVYPSTVPGGAASSFVLAAKRQPFTSWGAYLSGVGVQASIVADSEFYKMIIGIMMGYRIENIEHHIRSTGGTLSPSTYNLVEKEMMSLSQIEPTLPWK